MIQEEKIIKEHDSGRRPFTTPDGYFENFTDRMMARIQEVEQQKPETVKAVPIPMWRNVMKYAAAIAVAVVCVGGGVLLYDGDKDAEEQLQTQQTEFAWDDAEVIDDALDYEMVNNQQIAFYLTEAY